MNRWLCVSILLAGAAWAASLVAWYGFYDQLPAQVPVHWGASGRPDKFVPRPDALPYLLLMPGVMTGLVLLTPVLPWLSPRHFEVDSFRGTYNYLMALVQGLFAYLGGTILAATFGARVDIGTLMMGGMFLFFALMGNVLGKVRRNFFVGVRTPWTLASEAVWVRTHRLTAWVWVAGGVVGLLAILAGVPPLLTLALLPVLVLYPVVYSLVLYKRLQREGKLDAPVAAGAREGDLT
ncbi:MAG TPA: SdpI family protein [Gemmataceae bacterium]|jgi:uncharacterized membrane protein|nr:SdpI family protein [Gemmataceae bacterium]